MMGTLIGKACDALCKEHCDGCWKNTALLVLRIALGVIFMIHGYGKLFGDAPGMTVFTGMVAGLGFPMPTFFAYVAACAEFFGGIAMLLGLATKVFGVLIAIVMVVAFAAVKKFALPMGDADFALLAMAISLVLMGPGKYSLDTLLIKRMGKKA